MSIYTGVADVNGDFTVPFLSNYTSGQKITVTAEKDAATKTIELFAPSEVTGGGGAIQFSGNYINFPQNIGIVTLSSNINGDVANYAMIAYDSYPYAFPYPATGLIITSAINIGEGSFSGWGKATSLVLGNTVKNIGNNSFAGWLLCKTADLGTGIKSIGAGAFGNWQAAVSITIRATVPPILDPSGFSGMKSTAKIYVPASSLAAYKAAESWSDIKTRIYAIA